MQSPQPVIHQKIPLLVTDTQGLEVISNEECTQLLERTDIGRVGFTDAGQTIILPVNYAFVAGSVMFRTARGSKLGRAMLTEPMSLEIDDWDSETRTGWSVLVKGVTEQVTDDWLTGVHEHLDVEPWADIVPREEWVRIRADEITGRRIVRHDPDSAQEDTTPTG